MLRQLLFASFLLLQTAVFALNPGDLAFIAFNADGGDDFAIVALVDIPASSIIYLTDNEPTAGGGINTGEGTQSWNTGLAVISAGTVVVFTDVSTGSRSASVGTLATAGGSLNLAGGGDALFAFEGTTATAPTTWIAGIQNEAGNQGSLAGAGLVADSTFVNFYSSGSPDGGFYMASRSSETSFHDYLLLIGDNSNWSTETSNGENILPIDATAFTLATSSIITLTPSIITGLGYALGGTSTSTIYEMAASNLSPASGNISLSFVGTDFEVSETLGGTYTATLTLPYTLGVDTQDLYVRLKAGRLVGLYNDTLAHTGGGASAQLILEGIVTPVCSITTLDLSDVTCGNNTTASDSTDDVITFDMNPTGVGLGSTYSVNVSGGGASSVTPNTGISYGSATSFTLNTGSAGGGDVTVTLTDDTDGACTLGATITDPGSCYSLGCSEIFSDNFSSGLTSWSSTGDWTTAGNELKHNLSGVGGTSYIYSDISSQDLSTTDYEWEVCMRNGAWDPSSANSFSFFLLSSQLNLNSLGTGYAVGVNQTGTSDLLTLYSVNSGTYTSIITSSLNWDSNDDICIRVSRSASGDWELFYSDNGAAEVSGGTTTNTTFTTGQYIGGFFEYSSSRAGLFWIDDVFVCSGAAPSEPEIQLVDAADADQNCGSLTLDYGNVAASSTSSLTYNVTNVGADTLDITSLAVNGVDALDFAILSPTAPLTINPGDTQLVTVQFNAPAAVGVSNAFLSIINNDADEDSCDVSLTGIVAPACSITTLDLSNIACGNNATPVDSTDDVITFDLDPTGVGLGATYSVSVSGGGATSVTPNSGLSYGSLTSFTINTGSAGAGNVNVTLTDDTDGGCTLAANIMDPGSCFSFGCSEIFADEFSSGLGSWSNTSDWTTSSDELKHDLSGTSGTSYIYSDISSQDLSATDYEWEVCMRNGGWDPSGTNSFSFFLLSSQLNLNSLGTGYAVGVNQVGTSDLLTLYSVNSGTYTSIITTSLDWDSNDDICLRVTRTAGGDWELFYSDNGAAEVSGGTTTNTTFTTGQYIGGFFEFTSSRAGLFWIDDVFVCSGSSVSAAELQIVDAADVNQNCGSLTLDYGTIAPSSSSSLTFNITNTGSDTLDVSSLAINGTDAADFTIISPAAPLMINPGDTQLVTVQFSAPAVVGVSNAFLTILNNDSDEDSCTVNLTGISSNSIPIPDNGCATMNYAEDSVVYSGGGGNILDVNLFVSIIHTFRGDLQIELESPTGTIIQLLDGTVGGTSENLEVVFDDEALASLTSTNHIVDGSEDETIVSAGSGTLTTFEGEVSNGTWYLRICDDAGVDVGTLESWNLIITEDCTPTHSIASITPNNGPIETLVTINGTGFTDSTSVAFGALSATIVSQTTTALVVEVPFNSVTGPITVTEASCDTSSAVFTVLDIDSCSSSPASWSGDLLISGVYDESSGSCHYIEIYNPTAASIDLSTYSIGSDNNAASAAAGPPAIYNGGTEALVGTIEAYSTHIVRASSNGSTCNSCPNIGASQEVFDFGYNAEFLDRIFLISSGTEIDLWAQGLGYATDGFVYSRSSSSTAPTLTYSNSDWTGTNTADCFGFEADVSNPPTIDTLLDVSACAMTIAATTAAGEGGTIAHNWYYTDGVSASWSLVTSSSFTGLTVTGDSTNTLSIVSGANSTSDIDGYQFYLQVTEDTACSKISNAFQYTFSPEPFFRSASTGDWTTPATWEMATSIGGPWSSACTYPIDLNSDYISIEAGHVVTLDADLNADQIIVQAVGELVLDERLTVDNGNAAGSDLEVLGTLTDNGSTPNGVDFVNSGTWLLGATGTIVKTHNSSVNQYRDNYETGIANIPATGNWYFSYDGSGDVSVSTIDMYYPNLYFESTSGAHLFDGFSEVFKGTSATIVVKGDLNIGSTGSGAVTVYSNNTNATPIVVMGELNVGAGSTLTNSQVVFGAGNGIGTGFNVSGNLSIDGILDVSNGSGALNLVGSSAQLIDGTGTITTVHAELDNSLNATLDGIDFTIDSTLTFTDGKIITNIAQAAAVVITNTDPSAIIGGSTSGSNNYVEGRLLWTTDGSSSYDFPIGESVRGVQPFSIIVTGATSSTILGYLEDNVQSLVEPLAFCDLETHPGTGGVVNAGNGSSGTDGILDKIEFNLSSPLSWNVSNPSGGITSYTIAVTANGTQDISPVVSANGEAVRYLMKNGEPGNTGFATVSGGASFPGESGFNACPTAYTLSGMTSFSSFTLNGASQSNTTLPVEFLSLEANPVDNQMIEVLWSTATEINNAGFELQRSTDALSFETISWIEGNGNSNEIQSYTYMDEEVVQNQVYYYRLLQIDFDGESEYSAIVNTKLRGMDSDQTLEIYPNPSSGFVSVLSTEEIRSIKVFDMAGKQLMNRSVLEFNTQLDLTEYASGFYNVIIEFDRKVEVVKLIKE